MRSLPHSTSLPPHTRTLLFSSPLLAMLLTIGCANEYDFDPKTRQVGTVGQEAHAILLKDAARSPRAADAKVTLLTQQRDPFVRAVDTIAPPQQLALLDLFLQGTLYLIDNELLPSLSRKGAAIAQEAAQDQELLFALSDSFLPQPADFISPISTPDLIGYLAAYPDLRRLGSQGARLVLNNDGYTDAGELDSDEPNGFTELIRTLATALLDIDPDPLAEPLAILVRDLLLKQDERYTIADATRPLLVAVYDARGLPLVEPDVLLELFVDADGDGQPDLDEDGNFLLRQGGSMPPNAFARDDGSMRDAFGRLRAPSQGLAIQYIDLNKTGLAFLLREYADLAERGVASDLFATLRHVMGPTVIAQDERGPYRGFGRDNPLVDLTWGLTRALTSPNLPELVRDAAELFEHATSQLAGILFALEQSAPLLAKYPTAELGPTQTLLIDLIPTLHAIASDEALWHDFMRVLADPMTPRAGEAMVTLLSYQNTRAKVALGGPYDACFQQCKSRAQLGTPERFECVRSCPNKEIFQLAMDFNAPESPSARSQLQALWHLMWSLSGVPYAMEIDQVKINNTTYPAPPPLIRLPGGAEAFLQSVAGNLDLANAVPPELFSGSELGPLLSAFNISNENIAGLVELLSELFGVQLSQKPTPDELTRMFTLDDIAFRADDNSTVLDIREPVDAEGYRLPDNMADGLFEAEASGLIDAIVPMARAFSRHGKEHLLLQLFTVVHMHYPGDPSLYIMKNTQRSPSRAANLRSYEPVIKELLEQGTLLKALFDLTSRINQLEASRSLMINEQLRQFILHATRPNSLTTRDGLDFLNLPDGRTQRDLTPLHILVDSLTRITQAVSQDPEASARLSRAVSALLDLAIAVEWPEGQPPRFVKEGSVALSIGSMQFVAERATLARDAGTLEAWLTQDLYDTLADLWSSRLFAGLVLIAEQLLEDPDNVAVIQEVTAYLLGSPQGREHTSLIAYQLVLRSVNTAVWVPLARATSRLLDPDRDWGTRGPFAKLPPLSQGALLLHHIMRDDEQEVGVNLMRRALTRSGDTPAPLFTLSDIFARFMRQNPASTEPLNAEDYRLILTTLAAWMRDEARGLEQLYDLVALRVKD